MLPKLAHVNQSEQAVCGGQVNDQRYRANDRWYPTIGSQCSFQSLGLGIGWADKMHLIQCVSEPRFGLV